MTDRLKPEERSIIMSSVRSKDTAPELIVRSALHRAGYRYSLHRKDLPGKPDLVFTSRHKLVFIHGCFWHGHENCNQGGLSKSNREFWARKLANNRARDQRAIEELVTMGWEVLVIWSCNLRSATKILDTITQITRFLEK